MSAMAPTSPPLGLAAVFLAANASYAHANPAAWSLGRVAVAAGWKWHVIETVPGEPHAHLLTRISKHQPQVLAATFFLFNRVLLSEILARYKMLYPACRILGGGPEFLGDNRPVFQQYPWLDAVIRGEGEIALAAWLAVWDQPRRWREIAGVCAMVDGAYIDNGWAPLPDLAEMPPALPENLEQAHKPFVLMETSRGCSAQCVFCTSGAGRGPTRHHQLAHVRANLQRIQAAGVKEVRLGDRTFNETPQRCLELLRMFKEEFPGLRFHLEIDAGRLTSEVCQALAAALPGQIYLEVGVQTLTKPVFDRLGRCGRFETVLANTRALCAMRHLAVHVDLLAGLPGSSLANLLCDLTALVAMRPAVIQLETLKILPGTCLAGQADRLGMRYAPVPPYEVLATEAMAPEDMETARRLSCLVDWFYNAPPLHDVTAHAAEVLQDFWRSLAEKCAAWLSGCMAPSLENRFKILAHWFKSADEFMPLRARLVYARLKHGLASALGVDVQPWKKPLPADAELIEGAAVQMPAYVCRVQLEGSAYFFVYSRRQGPAAAVYRLGGHCSAGIG